jgi:hypothetical protein
MTWGKGRGAITVLVVAVLVVAVADRFARRTAPRRRAPPAPYVHPIVPTPPVVNPPPPNCRARDLQGATEAVRQLRDNAAAAATSARKAAPRTCRDEPATRAMEARIDMIGQSVSGCVARDAELDSAWNLVQSAVLALQGCADCAGERAAREKGCARAAELIAQAEKAIR